MTELTKLGYNKETMFAFFKEKMPMLERYKGLFVESVTEQFRVTLSTIDGFNTNMQAEAIKTMQEQLGLFGPEIINKVLTHILTKFQL